MLISQGEDGIILWRSGRSRLAVSNFSLRRGSGSRAARGLHLFNGIVGRLGLLDRLYLVRFLDGVEAIVRVTSLMLDLLGLGEHLKVQFDIWGRLPPGLADNSGDFGLSATLEICTLPRHVGAIEDPTVGWPGWPLWVLLMGHWFVRVCVCEAGRTWFVYGELAVSGASVRYRWGRGRGRIDASLRDTNGETSRAPDADGGRRREVVGFEFGVSQRDLALWVHGLSSQHG